MHRFHYFIISACMLFTSCNKDEVITEEVGGQPIIELDSETGIYTVKVDRSCRVHSVLLCDESIKTNCLLSKIHLQLLFTDIKIIHT